MIFDTEMAKTIAKLLLQVNAIQIKKQNYFTWASGIKSPIYCDNRILLSHVKQRNIIKNIFYNLIEGKFSEATAISGVATAGIGIGALVADAMSLPFSYVRDKSKAHGRQNSIEGDIAADAKIVVIEDLISTGGSTLKAVNTLKEANYHVIGAAAIFSYGFENAKNAFKEVDVPYYTLSEYSFLLDLLESENVLSPEEKNRLQSWQANPEAFN